MAVNLPVAVEAIFIKLRHTITTLKPSCLRVLYVALTEANNYLVEQGFSTDGIITDDAFENTMMDNGLFFTKSEMWQLKRHFGTESGALKWREIFTLIRGQISPAKTQCMNKIFNKYQENGLIKMDSLITNFNAENHPDVIHGISTANRALREYVAIFTGYIGRLSKPAFLTIFSDMSPYFYDDQTFLEFFEGVYGIPIPKIKKDDTLHEVRKILRDKLRNRQRGNESFEQTLMRHFKHYDLDANESLTLDEFQECFRRLGIILPIEFVEELFQHVDKDNDGHLNYKEFTKAFINEC